MGGEGEQEHVIRHILQRLIPSSLSILECVCCHRKGRPRSKKISFVQAVDTWKS